LGFRKQGDALGIDPCIPKAWPGFELDYRHRGRTRYTIRVENPHGVCRGVATLELDGQSLPAGEPVALLDDGAAHVVRGVAGWPVGNPGGFGGADPRIRSGGARLRVVLGVVRAGP